VKGAALGMQIKSAPHVQDTLSLRPSYHYGFDYLRAFMSLAVVAWHLRIFGISALFDKNEFVRHAISFSDIINFHLLLLAVPVFFLISLFLSFEKGVMNNSYFSRRVGRIAGLYGFWLSFFFLIYGWRSGFASLGPASGKDLLVKIASGWSTLYYFFFSLLLMTCLARIVARMRRAIVWLLLVVSLASLWGTAFLVKIGAAPNYLVAYWNPLNFVPYVFIARLLADNADKNLCPPRALLFFLLAVGFVFAAFFEWQWMISSNNFQYNDSALPAYTRVSLVLAAVMVFCWSFLIRHRPNRLIRFLSDYSLGLYCLHGYVSLLLYDKIVTMTNKPFSSMIAFISIIMISLAVAVVLRRLLGRWLL